MSDSKIFYMYIVCFINGKTQIDNRFRQIKKKDELVYRPNIKHER